VHASIQPGLYRVLNSLAHRSGEIGKLLAAAVQKQVIGTAEGLVPARYTAQVDLEL
jgi:hypothetical protein